MLIEMICLDSRLGVVVVVFSGDCWCFQEELVDRVLICDLDVHQGDGTAEILKERQVDVKGTLGHFEVCTQALPL